MITSIILEEKRQSRFSIIAFYERRARRILPALSFLLVFTTIAAYIALPAHSLKGYSQSLVSVSTFSSNLYFYLTGGYFAPAAHETQLLHTWSLAVEEQYYLLFPVMVVLLWSWGQKPATGPPQGEASAQLGKHRDILVPNHSSTDAFFG